MSIWSDLVGTTRSFFRIGFAGPRLKNAAGTLAVRNAGDTADAEIIVKQLHNTDDQIEINSDAAGAGADRKLTLRKNAAATADLTIDFPAAKGTDGYLVRQKPGTAAGVLELELVAPSSTSANTAVDTTSLGFGSTSPVAMFQLAATAVIQRIQVVIDTPFNGAPSVSVGIAGSTSKYAAATDIDLPAAAATVFEIHPGLPAQGVAENLIATYASGTATAGAARILVDYVDSPS